MLKFMQKKDRKSGFLFFLILIIIILSISLSIYLSINHYNVHTDIAHQSFCSISTKINCDTVAESPYAVFLGLPVAVWGTGGYLLFLLIFLLNTLFKDDRFLPFLFLLSVIFLIVGIVFGFISSIYIKSYCILCVITYLLNALLFLSVYSAITRKKYSFRQDYSALFLPLINKRIAIILLSYLFLFIAVWFFFPDYWNRGLLSNDNNLHHGLTDERNPWIGAKKPVITITEYSDYMCFKCYKMHHSLRNLVSKYPDLIRLVHVNYPLDKEFNSVVVPDEFHAGSGSLALLSVYAAKRDDFWKINDSLYKLGRTPMKHRLNDLAEKTGLSKNDVLRALNLSIYNKFLQIEILKGMKNGITGTPSYVIDGNVYLGYIPEEVFAQYDVEL